MILFGAMPTKPGRECLPLFSTRLFLIISVLLLAVNALPAVAEDFSLVDAQENEINVEVMPADGNFLVIWLVDHEEERLPFETMLWAINCSGVRSDELICWRIILFHAAVRMCAPCLEMALQRCSMPLIFTIQNRLFLLHMTECPCLCCVGYVNGSAVPWSTLGWLEPCFFTPICLVLR
ncbi:hypothetical protein [Candidatus Vondammii sp. HM_W22]|uniref:hypothetical protein n=1 Tax=Candidatus Vondammii sp. HM_W22 TaxID=2687299 RepID=UPI002E7C0639|nr:hypothetical protein [Candidatus Vondammii sp. HM_W22]